MNKIKLKLTLENMSDVCYGDTIICEGAYYTAEWHHWGGLAVDGIPLHIFIGGHVDVFLIEREV